MNEPRIAFRRKEHHNEITQQQLLADILSILPTENTQEITTVENACLSWANQGLNPLLRLLTLSSLLRTSDCHDFQKNLIGEIFKLDNQEFLSFIEPPNAFMDTLELIPLIELLTLRYGSDFNYQLAVLLCGVTYPNLPDDIKVELKARQEDISAILAPHQKDWYLCTDAERVFEEALDTHRWVASGSMVIKGVGRMVGLPTETIITTSGKIFLRGVFYSPIYTKTRMHFRGSLGSRCTSTSPPFSPWVPLRDCQNYALLNKLRDQVLNLPESHPKTKIPITAHMQRTMYEEEMDEY